MTAAEKDGGVILQEGSGECVELVRQPLGVGHCLGPGDRQASRAVVAEHEESVDTSELIVCGEGEHAATTTLASISPTVLYCAS